MLVMTQLCRSMLIHVQVICRSIFKMVNTYKNECLYTRTGACPELGAMEVYGGCETKEIKGVYMNS